MRLRWWVSSSSRFPSRPHIDGAGPPDPQYPSPPLCRMLLLCCVLLTTRHPLAVHPLPLPVQFHYCRPVVAPPPPVLPSDGAAVLCAVGAGQRHGAVAPQRGVRHRLWMVSYGKAVNGGAGEGMAPRGKGGQRGGAQAGKQGAGEEGKEGRGYQREGDEQR